jgi:hypothetical protein
MSANDFQYSEARYFRNFIVRVFEHICVLMVVVPTALLAMGAVFTGHLAGLLAAAIWFLLAAFAAGGAMTLLAIADNTKIIAKNSSETVKLLAVISMREVEIANDVARLEGAGRNKDNEAAVNAAISQPPKIG